KEASESYAKKLAQLGVSAGTHVGILSPNEISMVIAIHALSYLQAVSVMLNTRLTEQELVYQIKDAKVDVVITSDSLKDDVQQMDFSVLTRTVSTNEHI